jgi:hypothetical protein
MNKVQRPTAGAPARPSLRCEDCSSARATDEAGWIQVRYLSANRWRPDPGVLLYYCPLHAGQFDLGDDGVSPVPTGA